MSGAPPNEDIAIVGMACRFAGAADLRAFWQNVLSGVCAIGDPPDPEAVRFCDADASCFERVPTLRGGYLRDLWRFDPGAHGLSAEALRGADPAHFLALDLAAQALKDAGYADRPFPRDQTSILIGHTPGPDPALVGWVQRGLVVDQTVDLVRRLFPRGTPEQFARLRDGLRAAVPDYDSRNVPSLVPATLTARIASRFDLHGTQSLVDAACASSLVALGAAAQELRSGVADVVLAGGIQGVLSPQRLMPFGRLGFLSLHEAPHPFSRDADGTLFGEGGAILVLKRRADAARDGDRVYALLKAVAAASDGHARSPFAPREATYQLAVSRACTRAGVAPRSLALVEAHGTGIPAWDRMEAAALSAVFGPRQSHWPVTAVGSVKSMIGHCGAAAGAAGLVKAALSLYHRIVPPTLFAERPLPLWRAPESPFYLPDAARPWVQPGDRPRRAGVGAVGFGGIHAHAVLEEHPEAP
jgi:acyl transferase domain-containing protein